MNLKNACGRVGAINDACAMTVLERCGVEGRAIDDACVMNVKDVFRGLGGGGQLN